jgi:hypothetical protein
MGKSVRELYYFFIRFPMKPFVTVRTHTGDLRDQKIPDHHPGSFPLPDLEAKEHPARAADFTHYHHWQGGGDEIGRTNFAHSGFSKRQLCNPADRIIMRIFYSLFMDVQ